MKTKLMMIMGALLGTMLMAGAQGSGDKPKGDGKPPGGRSQGPPPLLLEKFDTDKDGKISAEEREAFKAERLKEMEQRRKEDFHKFDADKDGKLSYEEFVKLGEHHRAEMMKRIKQGGPRPPGGPASGDGPPPPPTE